MTISDITVNYECRDGFRCLRRDGLSDKNLFVLFKMPAYVFDGGEFVYAAEGSYCIFEKGAHTEYYAAEKLFCHDFFHFSYKDCEKSVFENLHFGKVCGLRGSGEISDIIALMKKESRLGKPSENRVLSELARYFFAKLAANTVISAKNETCEARYVNLKILREEILDNPEKPYKIPQLAAKMYMSPSYFQHLYKELFGTTLNADIIRARVEKAAALLMYGEYSVADTAQLCGYNSTEHFIRQFSKLYGLTPDKYRRSER